MRYIRFMNYLTIALLSISLSSYAQDFSYNSPVLDDYFLEHGKDLSSFSQSVETEEDFKDFPSMSKNYFIDSDIDNSFKTYLETPANIGWNTNKTKFVMMYDQESGETFQADDDLPSYDEGQIFFLELKLTKKKVIPVAFAVNKIDRVKRLMEITYLKENKSSGRQILKFVKDGEGTKIIHSSHYQTGKLVRNILYRPFHNKLVDAFHLNFKKRIEDEQ